MLNTRLLLTSPNGYAQRLVRAFEERKDLAHVHPVSCPMITTEIYLESPDFQDFIHHLSAYDYVAFSSRKAIEAFALLLQQTHTIIPSTLRLCAIGKDNELMTELLGVVPAFVSSEPSPKGIVDELRDRHDVRGKSIAVLAPEVLGMEEPPIVPDFIQGLAAIGMVPHRIAAYRTQATSAEILAETYQQIVNGQYHGVVFTSGTEIKVFLRMIPWSVTKADFFRKLTVICYGPYTARCAADYGVEVDFTSSAFGSFQDLVEQIKMYYDNKKEMTCRI